MKIFTRVMIGLLASLVLLSCDKEENNKIVGDWVIVSEDGAQFSFGNGGADQQYLTWVSLSKDGLAMSYRNNHLSKDQYAYLQDEYIYLKNGKANLLAYTYIVGYYTFDGNKLTEVFVVNGEEMSQEYTVTFSGKKMTLKDKFGTEMVYSKIKGYKTK